MSWEAHRAVIESTFASGWASSPYAATPVFYDNIPFSKPGTAYLGLRISYGDAFATEIIGQTAPSINRYTGLILIDVAVPEETGTSLQRKLCDSASAIFRRKDLFDTAGGKTTCRVPVAKPYGTVNGRCLMIVSVPFTWDILE